MQFPNKTAVFARLEQLAQNPLAKEFVIDNQKTLAIGQPGKDVVRGMIRNDLVKLLRKGMGALLARKTFLGRLGRISVFVGIGIVRAVGKAFCSSRMVLHWTVAALGTIQQYALLDAQSLELIRLNWLIIVVVVADVHGVALLEHHHRSFWVIVR